MKFCAQCIETNLLDIVKHTPNSLILVQALAKCISENPKWLDAMSLRQAVVHAITYFVKKKTTYCAFKSVEEVEIEDGTMYRYIFEIEERFFQIHTYRDSHSTETLMSSTPIKEVGLVEKIIHVFEEV